MQSARGCSQGRQMDGVSRQRGPPLWERRDMLFVRRDELAACLNPKVGKLTVN